MKKEMLRFPDDAAIGNYIADGLCETLLHKPTALICIAAGTSSFPVFDALLARVEKGELSFDRAAFIGMDEWVGLPQDADGAMADFLRRHFLHRAGFHETFLFDGVADPASECARAEAFLSAHGGIDAVVFGVGVNGHVALNEPGVDPTLRTHIASVSPVTANVAQKYFASAAPSLTKGVSIGLANAQEARRIYVMANTPNKRPAIERTAALLAIDAPSTETPASVVAALPQAELLATEAVFA